MMRTAILILWLTVSSSASVIPSWEHQMALRKFSVNGFLRQSHEMLLKLVSSVPTLLPRLDAQECLKRTICEAHNKPRQYGMLGQALQIAFPALQSWPGVEENSPISPLQLAARYGRDPNADCGRHYDGCLLDILDTLQVLVDYFVVRKKPS
ncbi:uncharacterized protein LOC135398124 [Ornithodoros turicata]|uniref:uncharacterized protein LOC135398124 n=1 Tax=Ornithodoros turicata TaxID=34597 RepID=UPI003138ADA9